MSNKIKNIKFRFTIEGEGIVNFDSVEQKYFLATDKRKDKNGLGNRLYSSNDNVQYAKKNFYRNKDGTLDYRIKISSEAMKKNMFEKEVPAQSSKVAHKDNVLYNFLGSPTGIIRGYTFHRENKGREETLKRKSPITMMDAEQTNNSVSYVDFHTTSGQKDEKEDRHEDGSQDTTIHKTESAGKMVYSGKGEIDLMQLQFVSSDPVFGRFNFNSDMFEEFYKKFLNTHIDFDNELGYFKTKERVMNIPEYGFKLNEEQMKYLVQFFFEKLASLYIRRRGGYAKIENIEVKFVTDPIKESFYDEDGWYSMKFNDKGSPVFGPKGFGLDELDFEDFYFEVDYDHAKSEREDLDKKYEEYKEYQANKNRQKKNQKGKGKKSDDSDNS